MLKKSWVFCYKVNEGLQKSKLTGFITTVLSDLCLRLWFDGPLKSYGKDINCRNILRTFFFNKPPLFSKKATLFGHPLLI